LNLQDWGIFTGILVGLATFALTLHKVIRNGIDRRFENLESRIRELEKFERD